MNRVISFENHGALLIKDIVLDTKIIKGAE
jgi:hypothetical protein